MLTIRFNRFGRKNRAQFRIVVQERAVAPCGRHVEVLGSYDPHLKKSVIKSERVRYWLGKGAAASDATHNLFVKEGVIKGKKRAVKMKRSQKNEAPAVETPSEKQADVPAV